MFQVIIHIRVVVYAMLNQSYWLLEIHINSEQYTEKHATSANFILNITLKNKLLHAGCCLF